MMLEERRMEGRSGWRAGEDEVDRGRMVEGKGDGRKEEIRDAEDEGNGGNEEMEGSRGWR